MTSPTLRVGLAQISPILLDQQATLTKMIDWIERAADDHCELVAFGEALLPGYPFWTALSDGAEFDSALQKSIHATYMQQAVHIESGHLQPLCDAASRTRQWIYAGCIERAGNRGGHSLYCSLVCVDPQGEIRSVHRKLMPTYEERLSWAPGDGNGLQVHAHGDFRLGGLNCWENWMPLARASLYAQGENVHLAVWPGSQRNTDQITRFMALEGRSWVLSVSGLMHRDQLPDSLPGVAGMRERAPEWLTDGGSCVAAPDGQWVIEPVTGKEHLVSAELDLRRVYQERQNFDPSGHYCRPDVTQLTVNRQRQQVARFEDD